MTTTTSVATCTADNPATCRYHGVPAKKKQVEVLQSKISSLFGSPSSAPLPSSNDLVDGALASSLEWDGKKPKWWKAYADEAANHPYAPSQPELLDVIDSPAGPLAVVFQEDSHELNDTTPWSRGSRISVFYYKSIKTGETLGYLKVAYVTDETMERTFGNDELTPFRWHEQDKSWHYGFQHFNEEDKVTIVDKASLTGEALMRKKREIWLEMAKRGGANHGLPLTPVDSGDEYIRSSVNIQERHVPDDATVSKDLENCVRVINSDLQEQKKLSDMPVVDFSRVMEPLSGKGYGTALYLYTARKLGKKNLVLKGSSIQTPYALKVWENFSKKMPANVSIISRTYKGENHISSTLDFRN